MKEESSKEPWSIYFPNTTRLKFLVSSQAGYAFKSEDLTNDATGIPVIRIGDIHSSGKVSKDKILYVEKSKAVGLKRFYVKKGDFLIAMTGATIGKAAPFTFDETFLVNQRVMSIRPKSSLEGKYLQYLCVTNKYKEHIDFYGGGGAQPNISDKTVLEIDFPIPPIQIQRLIAAYLNRETAKIDKLIAKQQKLIKLLQEKRQAVISQAVTKGLDPNVRMKDSGVEWLGEVPEHWDIQKLSRLTLKIGSGKTPRGGADTYKSEGILFIRSQNVYDDGLRLADVVYIDSETDNELSSSRVQPGDIFLNITGASIGRTCIAPIDIGAANVNQHVCIIRLSHDSEVGRDYLSWFLKSNEIKNAIDFSQNGAAREGLNFEQISNFRVPIPSYDDQKAICEKITESIAGIDTILHRCRCSIDLLIEHRQALITAAVTGKIDVRGLVTDEEVAALDAELEVETTEEDLTSEVLEDTYITEEE